MKNASCCHSDPNDPHHHHSGFDWFLWVGGVLITLFYGLHLFNISIHENITIFSAGVFEFMNKMWWGLALGILFVGLLNKVPRDFINSALGDGDKMSGIIRATIAGLFLDLCSHGILLVAMKLYERGASLGQVMAFLIASPWNSLSLTVILISLIGVKWTLIFIVLSALVALLSGMIFQKLVKNEQLPPNPNKNVLKDDFKLWPEAKKQLQKTQWRPSLISDVIRDGMKESGMLLRWIFLGVLLAAALRSFVSMDHFQSFFGPTLSGLGLTLLAATIIEVCSEGSAPIASDLLTRAKAPGNAFTFLMAGAATDYTEIMGLKEATKSWKIAFFLPLVTVPQILILGYLINMVSGS